MRLIFSTFLAISINSLPQAAFSKDRPNDIEQNVDNNRSTINADDIIVSARRRNERAGDVPIALNVIDSTRLDRTNTFDIRQLGQLAPALNINFGNARNTSFTIRNIGGGAPSTNDGLENGVGIYVDEVYYARPAQIMFELYDVDRIEVLRGPQGTLFGKNTIAGAINIISKIPEFDIGASGEVSVGNFNYRQIRASVTGPIVRDSIAFRLAASDTNRDGYITNIANGDRLTIIDNSSLRGQVLIVPDSSFRILLSGDYAQTKGNGSTSSIIGTIPTLANGVAFPNSALERAARVNYDIPFDTSGRTVDLDIPSYYTMKQWGTSAKVDWDLGPGTLTSISAYRWWTWTPHNDLDGLGLPIMVKGNAPSTQKQFSQELRINSNDAKKLSYTAGLYYFHQKIDTIQTTEYGAAAANWLLGPSVPAAVGALALDGFSFTSPSVLSNDSYAAYSQISWSATEKVKVTGGLRYTHEKKSGSFSRTTSGRSLAGQSDAIIVSVNAIRSSLAKFMPINSKFDDSNLSGQINLSYALYDKALAYATYARGFKAGGLNLTSLPAGASVEIDPETSDHFEVGLKTNFFNGLLVVNAALFNTDIHNYQATLRDPVTTTLSYLANVGKVRSRGVEMDIHAQPVRGLAVYTSLAFADAKSISYPNGPCPVELSGLRSVCNFDGRKLPNASKWSVSGGIEYKTEASTVWGRDAQLFYAMDFFYRSSFNSGADLSIYSEVPGRVIANGQIGVSFDKGFDVVLWSRNIFNKHYFLGIGSSVGLGSGLISGSLAEPRTYGLSVRAHY